MGANLIGWGLLLGSLMYRNVFSGGSSAAFENTGSSTPMVLAEILELLLIGVSIGILSYGQLRLIYTSFYAV